MGWFCLWPGATGPSRSDPKSATILTILAFWNCLKIRYNSLFSRSDLQKAAKMPGLGARDWVSMDNYRSIIPGWPCDAFNGVSMAFPAFNVFRTYNI